MSKPRNPTSDDFHIGRSRFLDAFAAVESAEFSDDTLNQKVREIRLIRNDLVHAELKFISWEGRRHAIVRNSQSAGTHAPQVRLLAIEDLNWLIAQTSQLKAQMKKAA